MKTTKYFDYSRRRPDRGKIKDEWIGMVVEKPEETLVQKDGRIRKWGKIEEMDMHLKVIVLEEGETVHTAVSDRSFKED